MPRLAIPNQTVKRLRDVQGVMPRLAIPNQTVKRLMYGYLRDAYRDVGVSAAT